MALQGSMSFAAFTLFLVLTTVSHGRNINPPVYGICSSSVILHGYKCQEHEVTTNDGYILSVQRIPEGRANGSGSRTRKQPVIIQHGVLVDGMTWLLNPPEQDLPLILADNGFDVWIANSRGTRFSRRHISLDPSSPVTTLFGLAEFNPKGLTVDAFLKSLCAYPGIDCYDLMTEITGKNCCLNSSTVDIFLRNEPQSTSTKNMVHLAQTVRRGVLTKFNYVRPDYNIMHYGDVFPPIYNLSNIPHDLPLFISYGGRDALSDARDVQNLLDNLKFHDVDKLSVQFIKEYAHADYVMGFNAKDFVYNAVISFFNHQVNT
ncbi:hypothetical protein ACSQ67_000836 [Phaseolus vulgaris]